MAGLLFVFILLIGAIIVKYSLLQSESEILEKTLQEEKIALEKNKDELKRKELKIKNTITDLQNSRKDLKRIKLDFEKTKSDLKNRLIENEKLKIVLDEKKSLINSQEKEISEKQDKLSLFTSSDKELKQKLKNLSDEKKELLFNLSKLDEKIELKNKSIESKDDEILVFLNQQKSDKKRLSDLSLQNDNLVINLNDVEKKLDNKNKELNTLLEDILQKEKLISSFKDKNNFLDDEIKVLSKKLEDTQNRHSLLAKDLTSTKTKIKNLTGIKIKVISLLKNELGKNMQIDPKNGAISLSSNILFDEDEYELKDSSKNALKDAVYDYFHTILENKDINKHIDKIVIEGHTNSKGTFMYNLELSQKRAYSVMDFLLSLDFDKKDNLKELIVASGRSFLDPIYDKEGKEDIDESRRIEIKFNLKNEEAIKEIANILE
jgi:chemotaxis protein MotB